MQSFLVSDFHVNFGRRLGHLLFTFSFSKEQSIWP